MGAKRLTGKALKARAKVLAAQALSLGLDTSAYEIEQDIDGWETSIHALTLRKQRQESDND